jgi:hypothetical protein
MSVSSTFLGGSIDAGKERIMRKLLLLATAFLSVPIVLVLLAGGFGHSTTIVPKGNFDLSQARSFNKFPLYYLGTSFEKMDLVAIHRVDARGTPGEPVREDDVTFIYGACESVDRAPCMPPLQVQVWNGCERNQHSYGPSFGPETQRELRGVPAATYEEGMRLELYTGNVTVVLFSAVRDRQLLLRAAGALRSIQGAIGANMPLPAINHAIFNRDSVVCSLMKT